MNVYDLLGHERVLVTRGGGEKAVRVAQVKRNGNDYIRHHRRPLVTEKGVTKKEAERTLCFEVAPEANKIQVRPAVEKLFKVKVEEVRTAAISASCAAAADSPATARTGRKAYVAR